MSPEPRGTSASSPRTLSDILAAEALAFAGSEPAREPQQEKAAPEPSVPAQAPEPKSTPDPTPEQEPKSAYDLFDAPARSVADILESSPRETKQWLAPQPDWTKAASEPKSTAPSSESGSASVSAPKPTAAEPDDEVLDSTMVIFPPMPKTRPLSDDLATTTSLATSAPPATPADALDVDAAASPAASTTSTVASESAAEAAAASTSAPAHIPPKTPGTTPPKPPAPDRGGFSGPPRWQENVPFEETGILLRPEALRQRAMLDETELIAIIAPEGDDGSEAAQSQRPGFWTGAWPRRALVALIMVVQALLTLRNNNSPFEDESLYLYSGHLELGHLLYGTPTNMDYWSFFSGAPVLYPPLGALADQIGGIFAARLLSLLFMLGTTGLLYLITRRIFGTRAGLCAAALFSCTEATIFVGGLATYDAPALFLLALATWIVVRFAENKFPFYLLAILPAAVAVGTKYVSLLFVPSIIVLAFLAAAPYSRRWALIRPVALSLGTAIALYTAYKLSGPSAAAGITSTTTSRAQGTDSVSLVMKMAGEWGGAVFAVSLIGAVFVVALPQRHAHPALPRSRWQRVALVVLLVGTGALAPVYQAHLHTLVSLQKHVGFGLFFTAPLAGYGLVRIVGPHFHRLQLGIGVLVLTFALGMGQSLTLFHGWPNSYAAVAELVKYQKPGANYLFAAGPNVIYQLRGDPYVKPSQISDAFSFNWWTEQGTHLTGDAAYADAIQAGYFQVVVYDFTANEPMEMSIAQDLYDSPIYKLAAKIYTPTSYGPDWSYVWVLKYK